MIDHNATVIASSLGAGNIDLHGHFGKLTLGHDHAGHADEVEAHDDDEGHDHGDHEGHDHDDHDDHAHDEAEHD